MNPNKTTKPDPPPPVTSDADARAFEERIYAGGQPDKSSVPKVPDIILWPKKGKPGIKTRIGIGLLLGVATVAIVSKMLPPTKKNRGKS